MLASKIGRKIFAPLIAKTIPKRAFFKNEKNPEVVNETSNASETEKKNPEVLNTVKLTEFTEDELNTNRLNHKIMIKSIEPYKHHNQKAYSKLQNEIDVLFRENDALPALKQEVKTFEEINKLNHTKLQTAINKIKESEQEALDIETRLSKELEKSKIYAISKFSHEVLDIVDNLELCMENMLKNKDAKAIVESDFYQGIQLTYKHAIGLFQRYGIRPIEEGVGHKMDPNFHDVLFIAKDESKPEGEIIHVAKKGYKLGERVLRASKVGVVRND